MKRLLLLPLLLSLLVANAQSNCIQFSKEDRKTVRIKEGKNISYVLKGSEEWNKGELLAITNDSLIIMESIPRDFVMAERESSTVIKSYGIEGFRIMAYNTALNTYGKGSAVVLLFATAIAAMAVSGGADFSTDKRKNSKAQKKFFKKNVNFDKGWSVRIVACED